MKTQFSEIQKILSNDEENSFCLLGNIEAQNVIAQTTSYFGPSSFGPTNLTGDADIG